MPNRDERFNGKINIKSRNNDRASWIVPTVRFWVVFPLISLFVDYELIRQNGKVLNKITVYLYARLLEFALPILYIIASFKKMTI
jgi:hypothetical protein